jgi:hypothetical protein
LPATRANLNARNGMRGSAMLFNAQLMTTAPRGGISLKHRNDIRRLAKTNGGTAAAAEQLSADGNTVRRSRSLRRVVRRPISRLPAALVPAVHPQVT